MPDVIADTHQNLGTYQNCSAPRLIHCISLWQPWATLLVSGLKQYETRSWLTNHRGLLLIHAAKVESPAGVQCWHENQLYKRPALAALGYEKFADLPRGGIVGIVTLAGCTTTEELLDGGAITEQEMRFGDFAPDRYGWRCENARSFRSPIQTRGKQGFWMEKLHGVPGLAQQLAGCGHGIDH